MYNGDIISEQLIHELKKAHEFENFKHIVYTRITNTFIEHSTQVHWLVVNSMLYHDEALRLLISEMDDARRARRSSDYEDETRCLERARIRHERYFVPYKVTQQGSKEAGLNLDV